MCFQSPDEELVAEETAFVVHAATILKVESLSDLTVSANSLVLYNIKSGMAGDYKCVASVASDKLTVKSQTVVQYRVEVTKGRIEGERGLHKG